MDRERGITFTSPEQEKLFEDYVKAAHNIPDGVTFTEEYLRRKNRGTNRTPKKKKRK